MVARSAVLTAEQLAAALDRCSALAGNEWGTRMERARLFRDLRAHVRAQGSRTGGGWRRFVQQNRDQLGCNVRRANELIRQLEKWERGDLGTDRVKALAIPLGILGATADFDENMTTDEARRRLETIDQTIANIEADTSGAYAAALPLHQEERQALMDRLEDQEHPRQAEPDSPVVGRVGPSTGVEGRGAAPGTRSAEPQHGQAENGHQDSRRRPPVPLTQQAQRNGARQRNTRQRNTSLQSCVALSGGNAVGEFRPGETAYFLSVFDDLHQIWPVRITHVTESRVYVEGDGYRLENGPTLWISRDASGPSVLFASLDEAQAGYRERLDQEIAKKEEQRAETIRRYDDEISDLRERAERPARLRRPA